MMPDIPGVDPWVPCFRECVYFYGYLPDYCAEYCGVINKQKE